MATGTDQRMVSRLMSRGVGRLDEAAGGLHFVSGGGYLERSLVEGARTWQGPTARLPGSMRQADAHA